MSDSWYCKGNAAPNRKQFEENAKNVKIFRFWLKENETKEIVFIGDPKDEPFLIAEHKVQVGNRWETITCLGETCKCCLLDKTKVVSAYYSILDLTPYTSKRDNKKYPFSKRALAVGKEMTALLEKRTSDTCGGSLQRAKFRVSRIGERSFTSGNDFQFIQKVDEAKFKALGPEYQPYEFLDLLRPNATRMNMLLNFVQSGNAGFQSRDDLRNDLSSDPFGSSTPPPQEPLSGGMMLSEPEDIPF